MVGVSTERVRRIANSVTSSLRQFVRAVLVEYKDKLHGGLADDMTPKDFDEEALEKGIEFELEHTSDRALAKEIAMDHLTEDPRYYEKLARIEK